MAENWGDRGCSHAQSTCPCSQMFPRSTCAEGQQEWVGGLQNQKAWGIHWGGLHTLDGVDAGKILPHLQYIKGHGKWLQN